MSKKLILLIFVLLLIPLSVQAHSGRTDSFGCHTNRKTGEYHCHNKKVKSAKIQARTKASLEAKSVIDTSLDNR